MEEYYNYYECGGVKIYITKSLEPRGDTIEIKLISFLWLKGFEVTGFKVL